MSAVLIDGKATSRIILAELAKEIQDKRGSWPRPPGLAVILVGDDPASHSYVRSKVNRCGETGIYSEKIEMPASTSQAEVEAKIEELNQRSEIDGILVQLPLPKQIDEDTVLAKINPAKDVDGFLAENMGKVLMGIPGVVPCTPRGILELLKRYDVPTSGKRAVVLGRSNIVGKPMAALLVQKGWDATVTVCHSRTQNLADITREADILIAAIGQAEFVKADMVKPGAAIIDVGMNRTEKGLTGDVDFEACREVAGWITPVPGGVGPMTIAMLLRNCLQNFYARLETD